MVDLLKDAIYGNCPLDAAEPPTTLDQSAEPSNTIVVGGTSWKTGGAGSATEKVYICFRR